MSLWPSAKRRESDGEAVVTCRHVSNRRLTPSSAQAQPRGAYQLTRPRGSEGPLRFLA